MDIFTQMVDLFAKGVFAYGGFICVTGIIGVSQGLKEHAGAQMNAGISSIVSGGLIILAAAIIKTITL